MSDAALFAAPARLKRLQIEITTGCNLRCAGCQRTLGMHAGTWRNTHMPMARLQAILHHAPPADTVILQGIGEPTLHPALPDMIDLVRHSGKFGVVSFNTNALARDLTYYETLRARGLSHLSVSVDSLDPATADVLRAGTDCDRLRQVIPALARLFQGAVTLSVVLSRRNLPALGTLLRQLYDLGARVVEVQPLVSYGPAADLLALGPDDMRAGREAIAAIRRQLPNLTVLPAPALTPDGSRCRRPFRAGYVTVDGYLTPCCLTNDPNLFGRVSLAEMPFAEVWESAGVRRFMDAYFDAEPAICQGCAFNPSASGTGGAADRRLDAANGQLRSGDRTGAEAAFHDLLNGAPAESLHGLGLARLQAGDAAQAEILLRAARTIVPGPRVTHNLVMALQQAGRPAEAIALARENLAAHPDYVPSYPALSGWLAAAGDRAGAAGVELLLIERALGGGNGPVIRAAAGRVAAFDSSHPDLVRVANRLRIAGHGDSAMTLLTARLKAFPDDLGAWLSRVMGHLAVIHDTTNEIDTRRAAYAADLKVLERRTRIATPDALACGAEQVGAAKPFFLSYQGQDDTDLQRVYGDIVTRMMPAAPPLPPPRVDGRIRVGFATAYFHLHSVSKLFGGWLRHLDRTRFEVIGYHLGEGEDAVSANLAASCARFHRGPCDEAGWLTRIAADAPQVLIYPEIGMHPTALRLACRRLAPVQCAGWGHPVTTGLPTIDHFLSSDLMEPADGNRHYTESLVRLPNLSICYRPPSPDSGRMTRADFGLADGDLAYLCCQSAFKYHPGDDGLWVAIAARVPAARFVFIGDVARDPNAARLHARLSRAFGAAGMQPARRLLFVPPIPAEEFPALIRAADICLDTPRWSGGNTTLEAVAGGLPVVTWPGEMMRSRHSAAILRRAGAERCIVSSAADYVALAVRLADPQERAAVRATLRAGHVTLFDDRTPVRALEEFLESAVRAACRTPLSAGVAGMRERHPRETAMVS
ncbi:MAG: radical SAM protein [Acetobacteraceae bacterium]